MVVSADGGVVVSAGGGFVVSAGGGLVVSAGGGVPVVVGGAVGAASSVTACGATVVVVDGAASTVTTGGATVRPIGVDATCEDGGFEMIGGEAGFAPHVARTVEIACRSAKVTHNRYFALTANWRAT